MRRSAALAMVVMVVLVGCSSKRPQDTAKATATSTMTTVLALPPPTTVDPAAVLAGCTPASEAELALIRPMLTGDATTMVRAYSTADGSTHYVAADLVDGAGTRHESDAVWVIEAGVPMALSGNANRSSVLPDARDVLGISAGDEVPLALRDCPRAAERAGL